MGVALGGRGKEIVLVATESEYEISIELEIFVTANL